MPKPDIINLPEEESILRLRNEAAKAKLRADLDVNKSGLAQQEIRNAHAASLTGESLLPLPQPFNPKAHNLGRQIRDGHKRVPSALIKLRLPKLDETDL